MSLRLLSRALVPAFLVVGLAFAGPAAPANAFSSIPGPVGPHFQPKAPSVPKSGATSSGAKAEQRAAKAAKVARAQVGDRYVRGAAGPGKFDCSGLTLYAWKASGRALPHYSRAQYAATKRVKLANIRPGDLLFYFKSGAAHVSIYVGGGKMVSASSPRSGVQLLSIKEGWYRERFSGAGRVK